MGYITSPPTQPRFSHRDPRYYVPLRLPLPISGRFAFAPFPIPCRCLRLCSTASGGSTPSRCCSCVARALGVPVPLIFRLFYVQGDSRLSQVRVLPLYAHAPVVDPGGVPRTRLLRPRNYCLPLQPPRRLSPLARIILSDHHLAIISGFIVAACALASPLLRTPPLRDRTSVPLLACWLRFSLTGFAPVGQHQQVSMPIGTSQCFTFRLARGCRLRATRRTIVGASCIVVVCLSKS